MAAMTTTRTLDTPRPGSSRRKKDQPRTEIWSNLLRQTREAQARSRRQAVQSRDLILCGGESEDQRSFVERYLARPPPAQPPTRNQRDQKPRRPKGEVKLSNRFGYGYGHVTLFSPPQTTGGLGLLGGEAEEVAKVDVHTLPEPDRAYEGTMRRLLLPKKEELIGEGGDSAADMQEDIAETEGRRPTVCILMSWKEPWLFLETLRRWLALLSRALLLSTAPKTESPLDVIKEHQLNLTVVLQHTDYQEPLLREGYTEDLFDYITQSIRTCLLPLAAALVYTPTNLPPQQPGAPLNEIQKILYTGLDLDVASLQPKTGKPDTTPKHNVVDRMAIIVPSGWDSAGKIRLLSETFSPEAILESWTADLSLPVFVDPIPTDSTPEAASNLLSTPSKATDLAAGAEVFESASPLPSSPAHSPPVSPSKAPKSALRDYEALILDPNAHKAPKPPEVEVVTKPEQEFLAEMRAQLQAYEAQDAQSTRSGFASTTAGALNTSRFNPSTTATGEALSDLGDVSFNVGGVSYNTSSAEAAIERLKRPLHGAGGVTGSESGSSRSGTPRPGRARERKETEAEATPNSGKGELPTERLEEYFASLMKRGGGDGSRAATPSRH